MDIKNTTIVGILYIYVYRYFVLTVLKLNVLTL